MKRTIHIAITVSAWCVLGAGMLCAQSRDTIFSHALQFSQQQLKRTVAEVGENPQYPRTTMPDGTWKTVRIRDWTSGFFPGSLWYAFEASHDPFYQNAAARWTQGLEALQSYGGSHDIGFMVFCSYGNGYRLTKNEEYKRVILATARTLMTRYNPAVGAIKSWDKKVWPYPVIIDNMMNLELLFWASQHGGTRAMYDAAVSHAEKTMKNHFRLDNSTYHVVGYDTATGGVLTRGTHQGYADSSCWARGEAWAVYGFTMTYRFTQDERFLHTAERAADYFIAHLPADHIPYWDFQAPNIPDEPRDASAAAIAASGMLELSTFASNADLKKKYFEAAKNILRSLSGPDYLAEGTPSHGILNHAVGHKPANSEIDVSLIYGDYYFLEALMRLGRMNRIGADVGAIEKARIHTVASHLLQEKPVTITASPSPRSAGGVHDYFSEGDYWWPDPKNPDGPYIQRDGMTNPNNFVKHREALFGFAKIVSSLTAAYTVTGDERYAAQAVNHLKAWFVDAATMMNPHLLYAQAIKGKVTGRGTGIIDTIHLLDVARAVEILRESASMDATTAAAITAWFRKYLAWLTTHQYGIDERDAKNNHGTWWTTQVAAFAHLVGDTAQLSSCRNRFKTVLMPDQMAADGSFPLELKRTKPYNYSLFNLEGFAILCQILSTPDDDLWNFTLADGRNMKKGMEFMYPYIDDKTTWPYAKDVMHFDAFPARRPMLLFAGIAFNEQKYIDLWKHLDPDPTDVEVQRNIPLTQPILWVK
jgi:hypothetical protein